MHEGERWYSESSIPAIPGGLVWCQFPEDEVPGPGPKTRPALLLAARVHRLENPPWIYVQVAYGTSKISKPRRFGLMVQNYNALQTSRLPKATLFDLDRVRWLPWSDIWFTCRPGHPSPFIGNLPSSYMATLEAIKVQRQIFLAGQQSANDADDDDEDDEGDGEE